MSKCTCSNCGTEIHDEDDFCVECGTHRQVNTDNYCINEKCERYKKVLENPAQEFCGKCGKPTRYGNEIQKLL